MQPQYQKILKYFDKLIFISLQTNYDQIAYFQSLFPNQFRYFLSVHDAISQQTSIHPDQKYYIICTSRIFCELVQALRICGNIYPKIGVFCGNIEKSLQIIDQYDATGFLDYAVCYEQQLFDNIYKIDQQQKNKQTGTSLIWLIQSQSEKQKIVYSENYGMMVKHWTFLKSVCTKFLTFQQLEKFIFAKEGLILSVIIKQINPNSLLFIEKLLRDQSLKNSQIAFLTQKKQISPSLQHCFFTSEVQNLHKHLQSLYSLPLFENESTIQKVPIQNNHHASSGNSKIVKIKEIVWVEEDEQKKKKIEAVRSKKSFKFTSNMLIFSQPQNAVAYCQYRQMESFLETKANNVIDCIAVVYSKSQKKDVGIQKKILLLNKVYSSLLVLAEKSHSNGFNQCCFSDFSQLQEFIQKINSMPLPKKYEQKAAIEFNNFMLQDFINHFNSANKMTSNRVFELVWLVGTQKRKQKVQYDIISDMRSQKIRINIKSVDQYLTFLKNTQQYLQTFKIKPEKNQITFLFIIQQDIKFDIVGDIAKDIGQVRVFYKSSLESSLSEISLETSEEKKKKVKKTLVEKLQQSTFIQLESINNNEGLKSKILEAFQTF